MAGENVSNYTSQGGDSTVFGGTVDVTGTFKIGSVTVTSTAAELNTVDVTAAGTAEASKALVVDANVAIASMGNVTFAANKGIKAAAATTAPTFTTDGTNFVFSNLPTAAPTATGSLYNDAGTLKIKTA